MLNKLIKFNIRKQLYCQTAISIKKSNNLGISFKTLDIYNDIFSIDQYIQNCVYYIIFSI